jgi:hypothetical protein
MGGIAQALTDKDFLASHPDEQKNYLASVDKDFAGAKPEDQDAYLQHILPASHQTGAMQTRKGAPVTNISAIDQKPDLPGATPQLISAVKAGKTPGAPTQPTATELAGRMSPNERQANEFLLGAAGGASGLPEAIHPGREAVKAMQPAQTLSGAAKQAGLATMGPLPGVIGSVYHIGKELLTPAAAGESPEDVAERRAHAVGTGIGMIAPSMVGEGVSQAAPAASRAASVLARTPTNEIRPGLRLASKIALPSGIFKEAGPEILNMLAPERPVYPGATLPSVGEFYANRGADIMRREAAERTLARRTPTIPAIRTSPFEGATPTAPGATFATVAPMERPQVATGPTSSSGLPPGTTVPPVTAPAAPVALPTPKPTAAIPTIEDATYADVPKAPVATMTPPISAVEAAPVAVAPKPATTSTLAAPSVNEVVNKAMGVKPLKANVPIREQLTSMTPPTEIESPEAAAFKAKYPDKPTRQMAMANGEPIVDAIGNNPETMKAIHDLTRVELRQALINSGEDMGQKTVSNSKFAGEGSITRQDAFNRLLQKGHSPEDIVKMAKRDEEPIGTIRTGISMEPQGDIGMIERPTPRVPAAAAPEPVPYAGPERRAAPGAYAGPERRRVGEMLAPTDESARLRNEYKKIAEDPTVSAEERAKAQRAYNETNPSLVGGGGEELEKGMRTARLGEANKGISEIQARDSLMKDPAKKAKFEAADPKAKDRMLIAEKNEMLAVK